MQSRIVADLSVAVLVLEVVADLSAVLDPRRLFLADTAAADDDLRLASPRYTLVPVERRWP